MWWIIIIALLTILVIGVLSQPEEEHTDWLCFVSGSSNQYSSEDSTYRVILNTDWHQGWNNPVMAVCDAECCATSLSLHQLAALPLQADNGYLIFGDWSSKITVTDVLILSPSQALITFTNDSPGFASRFVAPQRMQFVVKTPAPEVNDICDKHPVDITDMAEQVDLILSCRDCLCK